MQYVKMFHTLSNGTMYELQFFEGNGQGLLTKMVPICEDVYEVVTQHKVSGKEFYENKAAFESIFNDKKRMFTAGMTLETLRATSLQ